MTKPRRFQLSQPGHLRRVDGKVLKLNLKDLPLRRQTVDINKMAFTWEHLQTVEIDSLNDAKPVILISQDHGDLTVAENYIKGPPKMSILSNG